MLVIMPGQIYIIRSIVQPMREEMSLYFVFMDGNTHPHRTPDVWDVLRDGEIERTEWPPLIPDMNPIDRVRDNLYKLFCRHLTPPMSILGLQ